MKRFLAALGAFLTLASAAMAQTEGSATGGTAGVRSALSGCIYNSSAPTLTTGQQVGAQCSSSGAALTSASLAPTTTGGLATYVLEPAASDNHAVIKAGAGQVYSIQAFSNTATLNYIRLYNATTGFNGCNSATNLMWEGNIPASATGAGFVIDIAQGLAFSTGISICVTGAYGQTSTTNATASAISVNVLYK